MTRAPLPPAQRLVLDVILAHIRQHERAPSLREIARAVGLSVHGIEKSLKALRRDGRITWTPGVSKSIRIVGRR